MKRLAANIKAKLQIRRSIAVSNGVFAALLFSSISGFCADDVPKGYQDLVTRLPANATYAPSSA